MLVETRDEDESSRTLQELFELELESLSYRVDSYQVELELKLESL